MSTRTLLAVAISSVLALNGCARLSPTFDPDGAGVGIKNRDSVVLSKESDARLPLKLTGILERPERGAGSVSSSTDWQQLFSGDWQSSGAAAVRLVNTYNYKDLENAMRGVPAGKITEGGNQHLHWERYLGAVRNGDISAEAAIARTENNASLLAKYNTALVASKVLEHTYTSQSQLYFGRDSTPITRGYRRDAHLESVRVNKVGEGHDSIRVASISQRFDAMKYMMAYAVLMRAYEEANRVALSTGGEFFYWDGSLSTANYTATDPRAARFGIERRQVPNDGRMLSQWLWKTRPTDFGPGWMRAAFTMPADDPTVIKTTLSFPEMMCKHIPWDKGTQKRLLGGSRLFNPVRERKNKLANKTYLTTGSYDTFYTNPLDAGYIEYNAIIAPRDKINSEQAVKACADHLIKSATDDFWNEPGVYKPKYSKSEKATLVFLYAKELLDDAAKRYQAF